MAIDFTNFKNDTARGNGARDYLVKIIEKAMIEEFGANNVVVTPCKIYLENSVEIPANTVCICLGQTVNKEGSNVDVVATISPTIKSWNTVKGKRTRYAVNFYDILDAIERDKEIKKMMGDII